MVGKGILMEVSKRHWVVMTSDGEFLKVPHQGRVAQLGEEVNFTLQEEPGRFRALLRKPWFSGGLAMAAVLLIGMLLPLFQPVDVNAQSYVYLDDTESSLVIGVNKDKEVVSVDGVNAKGKRLAKRIKGDMTFKGVHIDDFIATLLARAKTDYKGLLNTENGVIISQVASDGKASSKQLGDLEGTLNNIREKVNRDPELKGTRLETLSLPDQLKERAKGYNVSPGKYALWLLVRDEGHKIKSSELHHRTVADLVTLLDGYLEENPPTKTEWLDIMRRQDPDSRPAVDEPDSKDSNKPQEPPTKGSDQGFRGDHNDGKGTNPGGDSSTTPTPTPEETPPSNGSGEDTTEPAPGDKPDNGASGSGGNSVSEGGGAPQ